MVARCGVTATAPSAINVHGSVLTTNADLSLGAVTLDGTTVLDTGALGGNLSVGAPGRRQSRPGITEPIDPVSWTKIQSIDSNMLFSGTNRRFATAPDAGFALIRP